MDLKELKSLHDTLPRGNENALSSKDIGFMWGMRERTARRIMNEEMSEADLPVVSTGDGYFIPVTLEEMEAGCYYHRSHTKKCMMRDYRLNKWRKNWNQTKMNIEAL